MSDGMWIGLGIAIAGAALAAGLVLAARIVVRMLVVGPSPNDSQVAAAPVEMEHVQGIDLALLNETEYAEATWVEETLAKKHASEEDRSEALRLLDHYRALSKERAAGA